MAELTQEYFSNIAKSINIPDYNYPSNYCHNYTLIENLDYYDHRIKEIVNELGYIVIEIPEHSNKIEAYLENIFGGYMVDKNPEQLNYTKLQYSAGSKYYALSSLAQPIHTDEGYTSIYPKYVVLYCQSESTIGGCSIIVKFNPLFELIKNNYPLSIDKLFSQNALKVYNANGCETKPLLFNFDDNVGISYSPVLKKLVGDEDILDVFKFITSYVHDVRNQIRFKLKKNQLLILDNRKVLHGRTSFQNSETRVLYRYWLNKEVLC